MQDNDRIDAIISMNANMAAGALEIVKDNARFADIIPYGVGGDESLRAKRQGHYHVPGLSFQNRREFGKITFKCNESRRNE